MQSEKQDRLLAQPHPTGNARQSPGNPSREEGWLCSQQPHRRSRTARQGGHHQPQPCPQGGQGSCLARDPVTPARTVGCSARCQHAPLSGSPGQLQPMALGACCQPRLPLRFACVQSSWKHQLDWPQPEATYGSTYKPSLTAHASYRHAPERRTCALALVVTANATP